MKYCKTMWLLAPVFLISVILTGCESQASADDDVVAIIEGNYKIEFSTVRDYTRSAFLDRVHDDQLEAHTIGLNRLITNQLKRIDFFEAGLHENQALVQNIRRVINEEMTGEYFRREFLSQYVNDETIREAYENMGYEVTYRKIVLPKPGEESSLMESIRSQAVELRDSLERGANFDVLVSEYSQHIESARRGGYMQPVTWQRSLRTPMNEVIYNLSPGDIRIFESNNAFHIVEVTDKHRVEVGPFEEEEPGIRRTLESIYFNQSLEDFDREKNATVNEDELDWNEEALNQLVIWSEITDFYHHHYPDTMQNEIARGNNFAIVSSSDQIVDLAELKRLLDEVLIPRARRRMSVDDFQRFIVEAMRSDHIVKRAEEHDLEEKVLYPGSTNSEIRSRLVSLYNSYFISEQLPEATDDALRRFYEERKDSMFYQFESASIGMIVTDNSEEADRWKHMLDTGGDFDQLANEILIRSFYRDRDGYVHTRHDDELPEIAAFVLDLEPGDIAGPIEINDGEEGTRYAMIKCRTRRSERQLLFEEVKGKAEEEFIRYHRQRLAREVEERLREKYSVTVYEDILKKRLTEEIAN